MFEFSVFDIMSTYSSVHFLFLICVALLQLDFQKVKAFQEQHMWEINRTKIILKSAIQKPNQFHNHNVHNVTRNLYQMRSGSHDDR